MIQVGGKQRTTIFMTKERKSSSEKKPKPEEKPEKGKEKGK
ncbi:hypothetical protein TCELL_0322 [Thermogladius calderae 1633]|uniref:Uncharacterized protein n=1 Tax=Thermogladius calderae (strain DSM 22663 / VKM B-2946 / 1633) TaxID=1184251 RepID=I3TDA9_THEC1|nr:hypothetical protein TCELL_0322 [Thermogladius calderae 1633]